MEFMSGKKRRKKKRGGDVNTAKRVVRYIKGRESVIEKRCCSKQKEKNAIPLYLFSMEEINKTTVKEFILLAFSSFHQFQILLFTVILLMYIISVSGNTVIILLVKVAASLRTPMYFFIGIFSALEVVFVCVTVPNLLSNLITDHKSISLSGCFTQMYAFNALGVTECHLLAVMAFDRDLAINNPLRYAAIMNHAFYVKVAVLPWITGFVIASIPTVLTARLDFCGPNQVNHFFCDLAPVQNLACSDPFLSSLITSLAAVFASVAPFVAIIGFYIHILIAILRIKRAEDRLKAFSTCSSHLIVVVLFYGSTSIVYVRPKGSQYDKFFALMYTVFIPLLNPFIYTLRNKDVKEALRKSLRQLRRKVSV
ncbi:olfactory receptor 10AG1-like [Ascaphus truei]|uniref:olfactory receptor 10AG1-like n=1 Tax=Ascaphus truei TaxID=8439 RepID=UPI003F5A461E